MTITTGAVRCKECGHTRYLKITVCLYCEYMGRFHNNGLGDWQEIKCLKLSKNKDDFKYPREVVESLTHCYHFKNATGFKRFKNWLWRCMG